MGVKRVCIPNRSSKSPERKREQKKRWFRNDQKWRTGCEGRISAAKRCHGLNRCRYKGEVGMKRWVGFGVIADNLVNIGRAMGKQTAPLRLASTIRSSGPLATPAGLALAAPIGEITKASILRRRIGRGLVFPRLDEVDLSHIACRQHSAALSDQSSPTFKSNSADPRNHQTIVSLDHRDIQSLVMTRRR